MATDRNSNSHLGRAWMSDKAYGKTGRTYRKAGLFCANVPVVWQSVSGAIQFPGTCPEKEIVNEIEICGSIHATVVARDSDCLLCLRSFRAVSGAGKQFAWPFHVWTGDLDHKGNDFLAV